MPCYIHSFIYLIPSNCVLKNNSRNQNKTKQNALLYSFIHLLDTIQLCAKNNSKNQNKTKQNKIPCYIHSLIHLIPSNIAVKRDTIVKLDHLTISRKKPNPSYTQKAKQLDKTMTWSKAVYYKRKTKDVSQSKEIQQ